MTGQGVLYIMLVYTGVHGQASAFDRAVETRTDDYVRPLDVDETGGGRIMSAGTVENEPVGAWSPAEIRAQSASVAAAESTHQSDHSYTRPHSRRITKLCLCRFSAGGSVMLV